MPTSARLQRLGFTEHIGSGTRMWLPPLAHVPAGPFFMGSDPQRDSHAAIHYELPQHVVTLAAFDIGIYPVTVAEYICAVHAGAVREPPPCMEVNWQSQIQHRMHPVVCIAWQDAIAYCRWVATLTDENWRLPTEAEWEKAARGTHGQVYPWGDEADARRANTIESGRKDLVSVDAYPTGASPYGVQGMVGNVWEWCQSLARPYPYSADDGREDLFAPGRRVLRGGSWADPLPIVRAAVRYDDEPDFPHSAAGFRLVRGARSNLEER